MGKEFTILEGFEQGEKEIELSLELSIGGNYRKTEKSSQDPNDQDTKGPDFVYRSDSPCAKVDLGMENGIEFVDLNKRRGIQALRRQEARKKREGKLKQTISRGANAEDKLWLQAQQFQCRVGDRVIKENENFSAESVRKKEKNGAVNSIDEAAKELNLSLKNVGMEGKISGSNNWGQDNPARWFCPQLQCQHSVSRMKAGKNEVDKSNVFRLGTCSNANSSMDCDSIHGGHKAVSDGSFERNTAVSDYQNTVQKGGCGSNSDTGSNSSNSYVLERLETNVPSAKKEQKNGFLNTEKLSMETAPSSITSQTSDKPISNTSSEQTTDVRSSQSENGTLLSQSKESNGIHSKPPKPQSQNQMAVSLSRMPCVSTTGNGPNGKTITGFLYKYSRSEVSIMCVCHGSSFSPAEFVEHAGGVDISHPLRHITVVPSAFG